MKKVLLFLLTLLPLLVSGQVKRTIHVATAGTLPTLISEEEKYEIEELTLSGELNGTDFKFIRDMAGVIAIERTDYSSGEKDCWAEYIPTEGLLKSLNLAESRIVNGGEVYYYEGDKKPTGRVLTERYKTESDAISSYLFARTKLETIILPNSITSIGSCVFYNCNFLKSITIPKNVTGISNGAFTNCPGLTSIIVESGNQKYDSRNNCNAIIDNNNQLIAGCKNTIIPNSVTSIGVCAFEGCSGLTSINIPDKVTSIGDCAFQGCSGLKSVTSLNPVPPSITNYSLGSIYEKATLNVPHGSKKAYMNADFWKLFKTINEVGDINGDSNVDSSDIEEIKEYLMGNPSDYFNEDNADVNEDGYVNIADIVAIINIIKNNNDNDISGNYLTFVAEETGTFKFCGTTGNDHISYSMDGGKTWNTLASGVNSPTVNAGNVIMWRATLEPVTEVSKNEYGIGCFSSTGRFNVEGNIMSLLYGVLFEGKTSLTESYAYAFNNLFSGCTGLTSAENLVLPATTLATACYRSMFYGCTSLTTAPALPATTLATACYRSMFYGCTSLTTAPALPATTLAQSCYYSMFYSCTNLTTAPALPVTEMEYSCYGEMFRGCTKLTTAPELPATRLAENCYKKMFQDCTSLNYIKCLASNLLFDYCTFRWLDGVSLSGTFVKNSSMDYWPIGEDGIPSGWTVLDETTPGNDNENNNIANGDIADGYLTFVAEETGTFKFGGIRGNEGISYSLDDGSTWYTLARNTDSPTVSAGNKIMWKGLLTPLSSYEDGIGEFSSTGRFTVEGNIMSLLYGDDFQNKTSLSGKDFAFAGLFSSCTGLTSAENLVLPATTLANDCYRYMFYGCTSLTAAPSVLPATKLSFYCYEAMFSGCTSLTTAPELPATTLAYSCYSNMFEGCTSLTTAPNLPATALAKYCYSYMFRGCTSLNTVPSDLLPAAILADYCYEYMFYGCKKLYSPPILAAKTLVTGCYQYMFAETSLLEFLICLATDISATNCTTNWFQGNSGVRGHFYKAPGMNDWTRGQSGIKATWTIHDYSQ